MLILPIKKKWFDMILSGEKKEEYREIKSYYTSRFMGNVLLLMDGTPNPWGGRVIFRNGYSRKSPSFIATVTLDIGEGRIEWGAEEGKNYYILKICDIEPYKAESEGK